MPLTATFSADFRDFTRDLEAAQVHLQVFDRATRNSVRSLTRTVEQFSGQELATQAARMAEAVRRLGDQGGTAAGLLKLTDAELQRVTSTMAAATQKAERLGEQLPESLQAINSEIAKLPRPAEASARGLGSMASAFGQMTAAFSAGALLTRGVDTVIDLGREAFRSAGALTDLRAATGQSLAQLQQWTHVAEQGGLSLEDLTKEAFKLSARLDGGSDSVRAAVESLGLSFRTLKEAPDQLHEILKAADALGPSQERNTALVRLFGDEGAAKLARVADGYAALAEAAAVASDRSIEALDRAGDEFVATLRRMKVASTNWLGETFANVTSAASGFTEFSAEQRKILAQAAGGADQFGNSQLLDLMTQFRAENAKAKADEAALAEQRRRTTDATAPYVEMLAKARQEVEALAPADRAQLDATIALGRGFEAVADRLGLSEDAQRLYSSVVKETSKALETGEAAARAYAESLAALSGRAALAGAEQAMQQLQDVGGTLKVLPSQLEGLRKKFEAGAEAAGHLGDTELAEFYAHVADRLQPVAQLQDRYNVTIGEFVPMGMRAAEVSALIADQMAEVTGQVIRILPPLKAAATAWFEYHAAATEARPDDFKDALGDVIAFTSTLASELDKSAGAFQRLAQVSGRGMGEVAQAVTIAAAAVRDLNDVLTAAAAGDKTSAILAGVRLGANLAASLWDGLTTSSGEHAAQEVGRQFGVLISESMGDTIAKTADRLFRGDRFTASIFSLADIIQADGG
ncbi:MAG: hypothetical protein R2745_03665 [Vicinamibacterales bacterium]